MHTQRWSAIVDQETVATPPRPVIPNQVFYVTARTVTRSMRLRPDPNTVRPVADCLAVVSERDRKLGKQVLHATSTARGA
ncbi:MAG: hypothetical protein D6812_16970 [Deltaproteobacteria bacterium]|nr:MAG: hypothetical protein D6812_16970 [Deltaproteobacteria bacterium]